MERGTTVTIAWQGRRVDAFLPAPMPRTVDLPERVVRATERASASLERVDDRLSHRFEPLARLLLRAEGVASSYIEGVRAPAELVAVAEVDPDAVDSTSAWVADNLGVVDASLIHARSGAALTAEDLHRWHAADDPRRPSRRVRRTVPADLLDRVPKVALADTAAERPGGTADGDPFPAGSLPPNIHRITPPV